MLIQIVLVLLSLSMLVFIHELGHFLFAKLFKTRVSKFYLFFDWKFALFKFKPKKSDTEYGIGWLPLGGYCAIEGMVDERLITEGLESEPQPWEFRSKTKLQRFLILFGGVLFNILLAIAINIGLTYHYGVERIPMKSLQNKLVYGKVAHQVGFEDGDLPISIDGKELKYFSGTLVQDIANADKLTVIDSDGAERELSVSVDLVPALLEAKEPLFTLASPSVVRAVVPNSEATKATPRSFMSGDSLLSINGVGYHSMAEYIKAIGENKGKEVKIAVWNAQNNRIDTLIAQVNDKKGLGIQFESPSKYLDVEHDNLSFVQSIGAGVKKTFSVAYSYVDQLKYLFTAAGASQLGGFGTIGKMFPSEWNWVQFWNMSAFLSVILAVMNLLPIPALDGGHIVFLLYEVVTGRKPSLKWQTRLQYVGMFLLLALMIYANVNDLIRFLF